MKSRKVIGPVARGVLERIGIARAEYLRTKGEDLLWSEIGRHLGWGQPTTSAVKNAKRPVDIEELPDLARVLGVRPAWLVFFDGPMVADGDARRDEYLVEQGKRYPKPRRGGTLKKPDERVG